MRETCRPLSAWISRPLTPLDVDAPNAPAELAAICSKAMSRERGARYPNMEDLAEDLRCFLEGRSVRAYETTIARRIHSYWRGHARAARIGLTLGYVVLPLVGLTASFLVNLTTSNYLQWTLYSLAVVATALIVAGLLAPNSKRVLAAIGLAPFALATAELLGARWTQYTAPDAAAWSVAATAELAAGNYEAAVETLSAVPVSDRGPYDQANLVRGLACLHRPADALAQTDASLGFEARDRRYSNLCVWRALVALELGMLDEARAALREHLDTACP